MSNTWSVEELSEDEQKALTAELDHRQQSSCQSDEQSDGTSDLSMQEEGE